MTEKIPEYKFLIKREETDYNFLDRGEASYEGFDFEGDSDYSSGYATIGPSGEEEYEVRNDGDTLEGDGTEATVANGQKVSRDYADGEPYDTYEIDGRVFKDPRQYILALFKRESYLHPVLPPEDQIELAYIIRRGIMCECSITLPNPQVLDKYPCKMITDRNRMLRRLNQTAEEKAWIKNLSMEDAFKAIVDGRLAQEKLISHSFGLVIKVAGEEQNRMEFNDRIEAGNEGLMKAVQYYNPNKGFRFSTYATHLIKSEIKTCGRVYRMQRGGFKNWENYVPKGADIDAVCDRMGGRYWLREVEVDTGFTEEEIRSQIGILLEQKKIMESIATDSISGYLGDYDEVLVNAEAEAIKEEKREREKKAKAAKKMSNAEADSSSTLDTPITAEQIMGKSQKDCVGGAGAVTVVTTVAGATTVAGTEPDAGGTATVVDTKAATTINPEAVVKRIAATMPKRVQYDIIAGDGKKPKPKEMSFEDYVRGFFSMTGKLKNISEERIAQFLLSNKNTIHNKTAVLRRFQQYPLHYTEELATQEVPSMLNIESIWPEQGLIDRLQSWGWRFVRNVGCEGLGLDFSEYIDGRRPTESLAYLFMDDYIPLRQQRIEESARLVWQYYEWVNDIICITNDERLSDREIELLEELAAETRHRDIQAKYKMSPNTIGNRRDAILRSIYDQIVENRNRSNGEVLMTCLVFLYRSWELHNWKKSIIKKMIQDHYTEKGKVALRSRGKDDSPRPVMEKIDHVVTSATAAVYDAQPVAMEIIQRTGETMRQLNDAISNIVNSGAFAELKREYEMAEQEFELSERDNFDDGGAGRDSATQSYTFNSSEKSIVNAG